MISFTWTFGINKDAINIRTDVFVNEQGFTLLEEFDEIDKISWQIVIYESEIPIATGRIIEENKEIYRLGRIAVRNAHRKSGIGTKLLNLMEEKAMSLGAKKFLLGAQIQAQEFYEKCGYHSFGQEYMDCHVPHIEMEKKTLIIYIEN